MERAAQLFAEQGYGSVGISEVGEVAGLGRGALYYHIGSKEELLCDIMTNYMKRLLVSAERIIETTQTAGDRIRRLSKSFMETMFESRSAMTVCFREVHSLGEEKRAGVLGLHGQYQEIWERVFKEGEKSGECRPVNRLETKAILGMYFYSFLWVRAEGPSTSDEIAEHFSGIVTRAVLLES